MNPFVLLFYSALQMRYVITMMRGKNRALSHLLADVDAFKVVVFVVVWLDGHTATRSGSCLLRWELTKMKREVTN